jgi:hypothetical protein
MLSSKKRKKKYDGLSGRIYLRDLEPMLVRQFKAQCAIDGIRMKEKIESMMTNYIKHGSSITDERK